MRLFYTVSELLVWEMSKRWVRLVTEVPLIFAFVLPVAFRWVNQNGTAVEVAR